ncbi:sensor histidine kinase [Haloparvum sedimenti]|uniref:sensor histidine kinase n=1 Tax=Haloparvum sedimenti TaxID=1678448 RepID=UPI00071E8351|nr:ATP-binding protein [Haloparvum sedimenti]
MKRLRERRSHGSSGPATGVGVVGVAFLLVHVYHVMIHEGALLPTLTATLFPITVSIALIGGGVWFGRQGYARSYGRRVLGWTVVGSVATAVLTAFVFFHQLREGEVLDEAFFLTVDLATLGAAAGLMVGIHDVRGRRRADLIAALQRATDELLEGGTHEEVCERAVDIAADVLGLFITGIWLADERGERLEPVAVTATGDAMLGDHPTYTPGNSLSWEAYESGTERWYDDLREVPERYNDATRIRSELILPVGDHGVMNVGSPSANAFDELDLTVARLLARTTAVALDRTDREERLQRRTDELERQNDRLERFASVVSHDLRNPLSVASGNVELATAALEDGDPATARERLDAVASAHDRMDRLIADLLELSRQGETVGSPETVAIEAIAKRAWEHVDVGGASLRIAEAPTIRADPDRLQQLFENLFRNSIDHGGRGVTVTVDALPGGFAVADDGPGIDIEDRESVFEFGHTTDAEGTGLGLAIVREIAHAHGWEVALTAADDGGVRFEFRGVEHA